MAIVYKWVVSELECYTEKEGKSQVVRNVYWRYQATEGNYFAEVFGSQHLNTDNLKDFVAYSSLTKDQVIDWIKSEMGKQKLAEFKNQLDVAIDSQKNPPIVTPPLPWN